MNPKRIIQLVLFGVGIIFLIAGIIIYNTSTTKIKNCTEPVTATVAEVKEKRERRISDDDLEPDLKKYYYPVFEYTYKGSEYKVESNEGERSSSYKVNDKIELLINPNKPEEFVVKGSKSYLIITIIFLFFGIVPIIAGVVVSIMMKD